MRRCSANGPGALLGRMRGLDRHWMPREPVSLGLEPRCSAAQRRTPRRPQPESLHLPHQPPLAAAVLTALVKSRQVVPAPEIRPRARDPPGCGPLASRSWSASWLSQCCGRAPPKNTLVLEIELIRFSPGYLFPLALISRKLTRNLHGTEDSFTSSKMFLFSLGSQAIPAAHPPPQLGIEGVGPSRSPVTEPQL